MKLRMNDTDFALKRSNPVPFTQNFGQCRGVRTDHAYIIGKNLLLFGKRLHTVNMPDIAHEQEQLFINAIQKDDFNAIRDILQYFHCHCKDI